VQQVRCPDAGQVEPPLLLAEHEGVELLAADRTMSAGLVLEVDLLAVDEGAEEDHVARAAERVESGQLLEKHVGVVIGRKKRFHRVPAHCSTRGDEDVLISVAQHQHRDLPQPRQAVEKLRKPLVGHGVRHPLSAVGEIHVRGPA